MDTVSLFLLVTASLFLLGVLGEFVFRKTGVPDVVWLVAAGAVLGPVTGTVRVADLSELLPVFGTVALIVILFQGGSRMAIGDVAAAAPRATLLGVAGWAGTLVAIFAAGMLAHLTGGLAWLDPALDAAWTPWYGAVLGAILGGSSSLVIFPSMAAAGVEARVARVVEVESTVTDALCIVGVLALIRAAQGRTEDGGGPLLDLVVQFAAGVGVAVAAAALFAPLLHVMRESPHAYTFIIAAVFLLHVVVSAVGGSPAVAVLTFAIVVGNAQRIVQRLRLPLPPLHLDLSASTRVIHDQVSFVTKSFFFTFIGLSLPTSPRLLAGGAALGVLLLAARAAVLPVSLAGTGLGPPQRGVILWCIPRGMAAGILATYPAAAGLPGTENLAGVVFGAVVTSILLFAAGFRHATRRLPPAPSSGETAPDGVAPGHTPSEPSPAGTATAAPRGHETGPEPAVPPPAPPPANGLLGHVALLGEQVRFSHTIFALPFALAGLLLGAGGLPPLRTVLWVLAAMVGARTAAMAFNRLVDHRFDAANPRTASRPLPSGRMSRGATVAWTVLATALFLVACRALNPLCFALAAPTLVVLLGYSLLKRVTSLSHMVLGIGLGISPLGAFLAVTGAFDPGWTAAALLGGAVLCWVAGFDVVYACQDEAVDRRLGLRSLPAAIGVAGALRAAARLHCLAVLFLVLFGVDAGLGVWYWFAAAVAAVLLVAEHRVVSATDLSRVNLAFFHLNAAVSSLVFLGIALDRFLPSPLPA